jgi:hypothetical protein
MGGSRSRYGKDKKYVTQFWSENIKGRDLLGDLGVGGKIILKWILKVYGVRVWSGFMCLTVRCSGRLI